MNTSIIKVTWRHERIRALHKNGRRGHWWQQIVPTSTRKQVRLLRCHGTYCRGWQWACSKQKAAEVQARSSRLPSSSRFALSLAGGVAEVGQKGAQLHQLAFGKICQFVWLQHLQHLGDCFILQLQHINCKYGLCKSTCVYFNLIKRRGIGKIHGKDQWKVTKNLLQEQCSKASVRGEWSGATSSDPVNVLMCYCTTEKQENNL